VRTRTLEGGLDWDGHGKPNSTRTIDRHDSSHGEVATETHKEQTGARALCDALFRLVTDLSGKSAWSMVQKIHLPLGNPAQICLDEMLRPSREKESSPQSQCSFTSARLHLLGEV
jgi:hypothetical protein